MLRIAALLALGTGCADKTGLAPIASGGPDHLITVGDTAQLNGSDSADSDGSISKYEWELVSRPTDSQATIDGSGSNPTVSPDRIGRYVISLTVVDNDGLSSTPDIVEVVATTPAERPTALLSLTGPVALNQPLTLHGDGSTTADDDPISSYAFSLLVVPPSSDAVIDESPTEPAAEFIPDVAGLYVAGLTVYDGELASRQAILEVQVNDNANLTPVADCGGKQTVEVGSVVHVDGRASLDPEGATLSYMWSLQMPDERPGVLFDATAPSTAFQADQSGTYRVGLVVSDGTLSSEECSAEVTAVEEPITNRAPVANAGPDQVSARVGAPVTLDGSRSTDPDGDPLTVSWAVRSAPIGSGYRSAGDGLSESLVTAFSPDAEGRFIVGLTVCDPSDSCDTDTVSVQVGSGANMPPVADAGPDRFSEAGKAVQLDGSGSSDPNGDSLSFSWALVSRPAASAGFLGDPDAPAPSLVADSPGPYVVQLTVNDGEYSDADIVTITAGEAGVNQAPICPALADGSTDMEVGILLDGSAAYDPNDDPLSFAWAVIDQPADSSPVFSDTGTAKITFTPDLPGEYRIQLRASDGTEFCSATLSVDVIDTTPNTPPTCDAGGDKSLFLGETVTLDGTGSSDVDEDPLSFTWSVYTLPAASALTLDDDGSGVVTFVPDVAGVYEVQLSVSDGEDSCDQWVVVDVRPVPVNNPPFCDAGGDQAGVQGDTFVLDAGDSFDADGDSLTYEWRVTDRPDGSVSTIASAASIEASFTADAVGEYRIRLRVSDGIDECEQTITITATSPNRAPECSASAAGELVAGEPVTLDASATIDPDGDALIYQWRIVERPEASTTTIDAVTLKITTFTPDVAGTYRIKVTANDGEATCDQTIDIVVESANEPPVCDAGSDATAITGEAVVLNGGGTLDPDGDTLVYQWRIIERPEGSTATIDAVSLKITTFSPDIAGEYVIRLIVDDGTDDCRDDLVLTVRENEPPVCDAGGDAAGVIGEAFVLDASGTTDADGDALVYQWRIIERPDGAAAVIDEVTLKVTSFTPDIVGTYRIRLIVTDGIDTCRSDITLEVEAEPNNPPVCDAGDDQTITIGDSTLLNASRTSDADGDTLEYLWRIIDRPTGSTATIAEVTLKITPFTPDSIGSYTVRSIVTDGSDECRDDVIINVNEDGAIGDGDDDGDDGGGDDGDGEAGDGDAGDETVSADAGRDLILCDIDEVELSGAESVGESLEFLWRFVETPASSSITDADILGANSSTPSFTPDAEGRYELQLTVSDGASTDADLVAVTLSADGSVVILHLDEGAGAAAADGSPAGNDASITRPAWTGGRFFGGLEFNGESFLTISDDDSLDLSSDFTIDWWMRTDDIGSGWRSILTKGDAYNYSLWTYQDEVYFYGVTASGSYVFAAGESSTIGDGAWHHYAATVDDSGMTVYVDGAVLATEPLSEPLRVNSDALLVGRPAYSASVDMFQGALDEITIREGALSREEVAILADADTQFCTGDEDTLEPDAAIVSPASAVETDIGYIKVVGTATDTSAIAAVSVNGATAVPLSDNYADWVAYVPLEEGLNRLEVRVEDVAGNVNGDADDLEVRFNDVCGEDTVLLLAFDESGDGEVRDWGPSDLLGTASDVGRVIGRFGNALDVSGSGQVRIPHTSDLSGGGPLTMEVWLRRDGPSSDLEIIATKGDPSTYGMAIFGDSLLFGFEDADETEWAAVATGVTDGNWHHVVGVFDGGEINVYVDGSLDATTPTFGALPVTNTTDLAIGSYFGLTGAFNGQIDQLRVYDDSLSASEIVDLFTDGEACPIGENLALDASASATSTLNPLFTAENTVDNDTREDAELDYSMWLGADGEDAFVELDFGDIVGLLRIRWANTHNRSYYNRATADYRIVASPTGAFGDEATTLATGTGTLETNLRFFTEESSPVAARYLRFYADSFEGLGPGLNEIQVYGLE